jgi:hypothetical protein
MKFLRLFPNQAQGARYTNFAYAPCRQGIFCSNFHLMQAWTKALQAIVLAIVPKELYGFLMAASPVVSLLRQR